MFENIIEQSAVLQLRDDIKNNRAAPSMLFFGPPDSGKGSAALELSRCLSCENDGAWKCACSSCGLHRVLLNDDLLLIGKRSFAREILACKSAFLKNPSNSGAKLLFYRSIRKLLISFSPVLAEDDPKLSKMSSSINSLDENLCAFWADAYDEGDSSVSKLEKTCSSLVKDALAMEKESFGGIIPIGHIRRASYWCRLAPNGKRKTLIIENADNMREEGRNSLLKLLEEPPSSVSVVLTSVRREKIIQTILSRLRPYRFLKRSEESEKEIIRRVFQDNLNGDKTAKGGSLVSAYIDSFLPESADKTQALAAWFIVSFARISVIYSRKTGNGGKNNFLNALGERYAPLAEASGLEREVKGMNVVKAILSQCGNFKDQSLQAFLKTCLDMIAEASHQAGDPSFIAYNDIFKKYINEAVTACDTLNIGAASVLENLFYKLKISCAGGNIKAGARGGYG